MEFIGIIYLVVTCCVLWWFAGDGCNSTADLIPKIFLAIIWPIWSPFLLIILTTRAIVNAFHQHKEY